MNQNYIYNKQIQLSKVSYRFPTRDMMSAIQTGKHTLIANIRQICPNDWPQMLPIRIIYVKHSILIIYCFNAIFTLGVRSWHVWRITWRTSIYDIRGNEK